MSTRVQVAWMVVIVALALWFGWLWRFEPVGDCVVRRGESFSIVPAPSGAFDDLIPKEE